MTLTELLDSVMGCLDCGTGKMADEVSCRDSSISNDPDKPPGWCLEVTTKGASDGSFHFQAIVSQDRVPRCPEPNAQNSQLTGSAAKYSAGSAHKGVVKAAIASEPSQSRENSSHQAGEEVEVLVPREDNTATSACESSPLTGGSPYPHPEEVCESLNEKFSKTPSVPDSNPLEEISSHPPAEEFSTDPFSSQVMKRNPERHSGKEDIQIMDSIILIDSYSTISQRHSKGQFHTKSYRKGRKIDKIAHPFGKLAIMFEKKYPQSKLLPINEKEDRLGEQKLKGIPKKDILKLYTNLYSRLTPLSELWTLPLVVLYNDDPYEYALGFEMRMEEQRRNSFTELSAEAVQLARDGYFQNSGSIMCFYCRNAPGRHRSRCNWEECNVPVSNSSTESQQLSPHDGLRMIGVDPRDARQSEVVPSAGASYRDFQSRVDSFGVRRYSDNINALASSGFYAVSSDTVACFFCGLLCTRQQIKPPPEVEARAYINSKHRQLRQQCEFAAGLQSSPAADATQAPTAGAASAVPLSAANSLTTTTSPVSTPPSTAGTVDLNPASSPLIPSSSSASAQHPP